MPTSSTPTSGKSRRGFAGMTPERRREIAAKGGASVPADKRSYSVQRDLAASAGRLGGLKSRRPAARSRSTSEA